ncbi:MAG: hypothetical protein CBC25_00490 [Pelagibacteraceae bacterium TMED65]|nr:MAG: hypothetical protein CBC25_00490 [Pelagibacteraceae bacterium TMED65]
MKILIVGYGKAGKRFYKLLKEFKKAYEVRILRSREIKSNTTNSKISTMVDAINWLPDAAIICSPATMHLEQAVELGSKGINLLIEKPISVETYNEQQMNTLINYENNIKIQVGYILRYLPCIKWVKQKLEENYLAQIISADFYCGSWLPDWRKDVDYRETVSANKKLGGGALLELSHEIDLAQYLLKDIKKIKYADKSKKSRLQMDVEDNAALWLESSMCSNISIRLDFCTRPAKRGFSIRSTNGEIKCNILTQKAVLIDENGEATERTEEMRDMRQIYLDEFNHFIKEYDNATDLECTAKAAKRVLDIIKEAKGKGD